VSVRTTIKLALITLASAALVFVETAAMSVCEERIYVGMSDPASWSFEVDPSWPDRPNTAYNLDSSVLDGEFRHAISISEEGSATAYFAEITRAGWPMRAFRYEQMSFEPADLGSPDRRVVPPCSPWVCGLEVPSFFRQTSVGPRSGGFCNRIPLRPIWPGFAINTALHVLILSLPIFGLPALRRSLRRRRGLCTKCTYPLSGLPPSSACPECGQVPG
jgi:hypothetical protein